MNWRTNLRGLVMVGVSFVAAATTLAQLQAPSDQDESHLVDLIPEAAIAVLPASPAPPTIPINLTNDRIMGVIPDFQTVRDPAAAFVPLTAKQKWSLGFKENIDPFNIASAAMAASLSQMGNQTPKYGEGGSAYGYRFGAALADFATQNIFSAGLLATVLHQDPRYYRKGPGTGVAKRIIYSVERIVIARNDEGADVFNSSGVFGMMMGIAASNLYYPAASRRPSVMLGRLNSSFQGGVIGNLLSEFWPDLENLEKKFFHHR